MLNFFSGISSLCLYWHVTCAKEFTDPAIKPTMSLLKNRQQRSPQHQTTVNYIVPKREQYQRDEGDEMQIKSTSTLVADAPKPANPLPKRELIHHAVPNITQARIEQIIQVRTTQHGRIRFGRVLGPWRCGPGPGPGVVEQK